LQKKPDEFHPFIIGSLVTQTRHARRDASLPVKLRAGNVESTVNFNFAASQAKSFIQKIDQKTHAGFRQKRAEIFRSVVFDFSGNEKARKLFIRQL
jgi:hypothetical protein